MELDIRNLLLIMYLREFINALEAAGEAKTIKKEVDWNMEAGAMIRLANEKGLPAPFFKKIKGYPDGYGLFGEVLNNHRKIAIAMDLDQDTPPKILIDEYLAAIFVKPEMQGSGIGSSLLDYVKNLRYRLQLKVYEKNNKSVDFYKNKEFTITSKSIDKETGEPELVMEWNK